MRKSAPDLLDRRARLAAAACLSAFDFPAEMGAWGRQMKQAAAVCPGLTIGDVPMGDRKAALERAHHLITTMLAEIG